VDGHDGVALILDIHTAFASLFGRDSGKGPEHDSSEEGVLHPTSASGVNEHGYPQDNDCEIFFKTNSKSSVGHARRLAGDGEAQNSSGGQPSAVNGKPNSESDELP